ncbi:hypothetical protein Droror1_Dr00023634 [Drosera rotundifolia]
MILRRFCVRARQCGRFFSIKSSDDLVDAIAELNKEMEMVFGEPPSTTRATSIMPQMLDQETKIAPPNTPEKPHRLTHIGVEGEAQMVDVSAKDITKRTALASGKVILGKKVFDLVSANRLEKGGVLSVAKIAGIVGAKQTSNLIPLSHNINLSHVHVNLALNPDDYSVEITGEAATTGRTGVEMEALTAVTIAGLTVYDMCKAASKDILITEVRLERKTGGKSGDWSRDD